MQLLFNEQNLHLNGSFKMKTYKNLMDAIFNMPYFGNLKPHFLMLRCVSLAHRYVANACKKAHSETENLPKLYAVRIFLAF